MLKQSLPYIIALVVLILLFSLFGYPLLRNDRKAKAMLTENESELQQIYSSGNLPSNKLIDTMEKENIVLAEKYQKLREKLPIAKDVSIPEGVNLPLFFLEELKNVKERVRAKAKEKGVKITTEDLGLPAALPSDREAPQLIKKIYFSEMIINLLLETGISSIDDIKLGEITKTDIYEDIPLILSVTCDTLSFTKLLFTLENTNEGFFIIKNYSIISQTGSRGAVETPNIPSGDRFRTPDIRGNTRTEPQSEKSIKAGLELSIIRWR